MKRTSYFIIVISFLFIVPLIFLIFPVKKIDCKLTSGKDCPQEFSDALKSLQNKPLIPTNFDDSVTKLNIPAGYILDSVSKKLPSKLILTFVAEPLLLQISCQDCDQHKSIGVYRHILDSNDLKSEFPNFFVHADNQEVFDNSGLKPEYFDSLKELTESLYKLRIVFQNGEWISEDEIKVSLDNNLTAIFSANQIASQVVALDLIIKSDAIKQTDAEIEEIDLRYKMPVLRTRK